MATCCLSYDNVTEYELRRLRDAEVQDPRTLAKLIGFRQAWASWPAQSVRL